MPLTSTEQIDSLGSTCFGPLSEAQVAHYRREGYLVVEDLVSAAEIEKFLRHVDTHDVKNYGLQGHRDDVYYWEMATQEQVVAIVAQLMQAPPRVVQTMFLDKPPSGGTGTALHQDQHYIAHDPSTPPSLMACWLALTDTGADNGGLCVVPRSQEEGLLSVHAAQNNREHTLFASQHTMRDKAGNKWQGEIQSYEIEDLNPEQILCLNVPGGGGVFFDSLTVHGSFSNRSMNRARRAFATHYISGETHLLRTDLQDTLPTYSR